MTRSSLSPYVYIIGIKIHQIRSLKQISDSDKYKVLRKRKFTLPVFVLSHTRIFILTHFKSNTCTREFSFQSHVIVLAYMYSCFQRFSTGQETSMSIIKTPHF